MAKKENIIQWNCNGCKTHYTELKRLMLEKQPLCICLQESHFHPGEKFNLRNYNSCRKDAVPGLRAKGGVATFIRRNISSEIPI